MNTENKVAGFNRIGAAIIDLLCAFVLLMLLSSFVITPILNSNDYYLTNYQEYETRYLASKLVTKNDKGSLQVIIYNYDNEKKQEYDDILKEFYLSYSDENNDYVKSYVDTKKNYQEAFIFDEENSIYLFTENEEAIKTFFQHSYQDALNFFVKNDKAFATVYVKLTTVMTICDYIGIAVSLIVFYLIIPLIMKDRQTIGKKLCKLVIYNVKTDEVVSRGRYVLRFLLFALTIYGSLVFKGLPLLASIACMAFTKNGSTLHDLIVQTKVVDTLLTNKVEIIDKRDSIEVEAFEKEENNNEGKQEDVNG